MGQRSQIYVAFNARNDKSEARASDERILVARYYQWNFGSRMVSRAAGLIEWLEAHKKYLDYKTEEISRIADVNFDMKDVVISHDIIEEYAKYVEWETDEFPNESPKEYIFESQDNNDGKLFISIERNGTIKYAFTDYDISKPMTATEYMAWGHYNSEEKDGSNYSHNDKYISENATLMTDSELYEFLESSYSNIPIKKGV